VDEVGEMRPAALLGQHRHPEHEGVHARQQLPARPEHPGDLRRQVLGHQLP
jgi:hypothetical protein